MIALVISYKFAIIAAIFKEDAFIPPKLITKSGAENTVVGQQP